ncbi:MAG: GNAT family N-acetyltransferase [Anaerolineae bacterium]|nr:GNAT family N-acetyltransferase [Anaerolineae bacterium]
MFLGRNPQETAYALGDLDPAHWGQSRFWGAWDAGDQLRGVVLLYDGFAVPVLSLHGDVEALEAALASIPLPREVFVLAPELLLAVLGRHYITGHLYALRRMVLTPSTFIPLRSTPSRLNLVRLGATDADRLNTLYKGDAGPGEEVFAFSPSQVASGVFYGIEQDGRLVAAAGTHVVAPAEGVAAVGNVFTMPGGRGQGWGTVVTHAVTAELVDRGIQTIVLNVKKDNLPAIRVYEKLGYRQTLGMVEGPAMRRDLF